MTTRTSDRYTFRGIRHTATRIEHASRHVAHQLGLDCRIETYGGLRKTVMVTVDGDAFPLSLFAHWWRFRMTKMGLRP